MNKIGELSNASRCTDYKGVGVRLVLRSIDIHLRDLICDMFPDLGGSCRRITCSMRNSALLRI